MVEFSQSFESEKAVLNNSSLSSSLTSLASMKPRISLCSSVLTNWSVGYKGLAFFFLAGEDRELAAATVLVSPKALFPGKEVPGRRGVTSPLAILTSFLVTASVSTTIPFVRDLLRSSFALLEELGSTQFLRSGSSTWESRRLFLASPA